MSKDKLIVAQVAFKGAIDLIVAGKLEIDEIKSFMDSNVEKIMEHSEATGQFAKVVNLPKQPTDAKSETIYVVGEGGQELKCPSCNYQVYDNRTTKTGNQPNFKCANKDCTGGTEFKGRLQPWASWETQPPAEMFPDDNTAPF